MFGFSIQKLLVLAALVAAVWYGFKFVSRLQEARDAQAGVRHGRFRWPKGVGRRAKEGTRTEAEEMVQCPVCQAYVPARGTAHCGRADCPY